MKNFVILAFFFFTISINIFSQQNNQLEIPKLQSDEYVIMHTGYSLSYNEQFELANWVAYELTKEETIPKVARKDSFIVDPLVKTGSANKKDYAGSNYDKGHLTPADDMLWSRNSMVESFYMSNMTPQMHSFNAGIWKSLEGQVQKWAVEYNSIYIVTGPVLKKGLKTIGKTKVSVPENFYKVVLVYNQLDTMGIGFIIPHKKMKGLLQNFAVSIDSVETVTGIDFFPLLSDEQENIIESNLDVKEWVWRKSESFKGKEKK